MKNITSMNQSQLERKCIKEMKLQRQFEGATMFSKEKKIFIASLPFFVVGFILYALVGERYLYAKNIAHDLYHYPLPAHTKIVEKNFDYGVFFPNGPTGSGGYPTVVAFIEIESELSRKELYNYYNENTLPENDEVKFEIYFEDSQKKIEVDGKVFYERSGSPGSLSSEVTKGEKTKAIIQIKKEFSHPSHSIIG